MGSRRVAKCAAMVEISRRVKQIMLKFQISSDFKTWERYSSEAPSMLAHTGSVQARITNTKTSKSCISKDWLCRQHLRLRRTTKQKIGTRWLDFTEDPTMFFAKRQFKLFSPWASERPPEIWNRINRPFEGNSDSQTKRGPKAGRKGNMPSPNRPALAGFSLT